MHQFPLFARLADQSCLVVGGGDVARRKVAALLEAGANVTVIAPELKWAPDAIGDAGGADRRIRHIATSFMPEHIGSNLLVIAATDDREVNRQVAAAAHQASRLCNVVDDPELCSFIVPAVVDREPITIAISSNGNAPILTRHVRAQIEDWLPAGLGRLATWAGMKRAEIKKRLAEPNQRRAFWDRVLAGPIADLILNGKMLEADATLAELLRDNPDAKLPGCAWLVGAGPGDPGMLTRRAVECLRNADVILRDRLVSDEVLQLARRDARVINVGKSPSGPSTSQQDINTMLIDMVSDGLRVCRLKGGDPLIFGRGSEEAAALAERGLNYEIVPGITAAIGCAASAGIPLTHRDLANAVTFVTGHSALGASAPDWQALGASRHTLVIYMGVGELQSLCEKLIESGRAPTTPAVLIENGTTDQQRIVGATLNSLAAEAERNGVRAPALALIGEVAELAATLHADAKNPVDARANNAPGISRY